MEKIINIHKPVGLSPLDIVKILKEKNSEYKDMPITYAGRLDPMAEGVLLLLAGDEVHKADEYQKLDKEYEAEILFGFQTDTYDILGIPRTVQVDEPFVGNVEKEIKNLKGEISLLLPPYSSYKINGKPLFMWAREGKLDEIKIPIRTTTIHSAEVFDSYKRSSEELLKQITEKIEKVKGDFRQEEILKSWEEILNNNDQEYLIIKVKFNVSSGTYIRSIAHSFGGVLLGLIRTRIGEFDIKDSVDYRVV